MSGLSGGAIEIWNRLLCAYRATRMGEYPGQCGARTATQQRVERCCRMSSYGYGKANRASQGATVCHDSMNSTARVWLGFVMMLAEQVNLCWFRDAILTWGGDGAMILVTRNENPESGIETRVHDDTWMRNGKWKSVPAQAMLKSENCQPSFVHEDQLYFILVCRRWNRSPTRYTCDICIHPHECEREKITVRGTLSIHCVKSSCYMRIFY